MARMMMMSMFCYKGEDYSRYNDMSEMFPGWVITTMNSLTCSNAAKKMKLETKSGVNKMSIHLHCVTVALAFHCHFAA
jgi:hypothetical protein